MAPRPRTAMCTALKQVDWQRMLLSFLFGILPWKPQNGGDSCCAGAERLGLLMLYQYGWSETRQRGLLSAHACWPYEAHGPV